MRALDTDAAELTFEAPVDPGERGLGEQRAIRPVRALSPRPGQRREQPDGVCVGTLPRGSTAQERVPRAGRAPQDVALKRRESGMQLADHRVQAMDADSVVIGEVRYAP